MGALTKCIMRSYWQSLVLGGGKDIGIYSAFTVNVLYLDVIVNDGSVGDMVTVPNHSDWSILVVIPDIRYTLWKINI